MKKASTAVLEILTAPTNAGAVRVWPGTPPPQHSKKWSIYEEVIPEEVDKGVAVQLAPSQPPHYAMNKLKPRLYRHSIRLRVRAHESERPEAFLQELLDYLVSLPRFTRIEDGHQIQYQRFWQSSDVFYVDEDEHLRRIYLVTILVARRNLSWTS